MTTTTGAHARFDDFESERFHTFRGGGVELVADDPSQVGGVLNAVEAHARAGRWAFGFLSYEAAAGLDPGLAVHPRREGDGLPLAWFAVCNGPEPGAEPAAEPDLTGDEPRWSVDWTARQHATAVAAVCSQIAKGETYQCNLTTRFTARLGSSSIDAVYRNIAVSQRGAYSALVDVGRYVIASASPELFFDITDERITMRPMKGTAARGRTTAEDAEAISQLLSSSKERAENVMIVDLVRNDLNRIAAPGTVTTPRLLRCEQYPTVHQLTSDVTATLRPQITLTEVFRALFPCGSVTGAPKAKTMEIIRALESGPRGVYCGAIGFVGPPATPSSPPRARFSVAIRTAVLDTSDGTLTYGAGGGITWDSQPAAEYAELQTKAQILSTRPEPFHLIETLRHEPAAGLRDVEQHLARAADSARYFGFRFNAADLRSALAAQPISPETTVVRVQMYRCGAFTIEELPWRTAASGPVRLAIDPEPVDAGECWRFHKTSLRHPFTSRMSRHEEADDVLLVNQYGHITESCTANVAALIAGRWLTPHCHSGCLPGIERARLVETGVLIESDLTPTDLTQASGLALVSSVRGWRRAALAGAGSARAVSAQAGSAHRHIS